MTSQRDGRRAEHRSQIPGETQVFRDGPRKGLDRKRAASGAAGTWVRCLIALAWMTASVTAEAGPVMYCPNGLDLCTWDDKTGWQVFWRAGEWERSAYWTTREGNVIVHVSAHMNPGWIYVLDPLGRPRMVRDLENGTSLAAVMGESPQGGIILCQTTPGYSSCDTYIPSESARKPPKGFSVYPEGCLFPRFLKDGRAVCIRELFRSVELLAQAPEKTGFEVSARMEGFGSISNVVPCGSSLLIQSLNQLYYWDGRAEIASVELADGDRAPLVLWMRKVAGHVFVGAWQSDRRTQREWQSLIVLDDNLQARTIWRDERFQPYDVAWDGAFLFMAVHERRARLFRFSLEKRQDVNPRLVWKGRAEPL